MSAYSDSWIRTYDRLLRYQADLSSDFELLFFRQSDHWLEANNILDYGSGNSYYCRLLSNRFPTKKFTCIDNNPSLVAIGQESWDHAKIRSVTGSFRDIKPQQPYDFVFSRHVLSYLGNSERLSFIKWLSRNCSERACVLIIDADDEAFFCSPRLPILEGGNDRFKEELKIKGGNRSIKNCLEEDFAAAGFRRKITLPLIVHSDLADRKFLMGTSKNKRFLVLLRT
jgi:hypothetical protein